MMTNLSFSPLELIEIDNPNTLQCMLKSVTTIPPKMSEYIVSLDMSNDNKSWIRFVFSDPGNNLLLSCTVDKFFKSDWKFYDEVTSSQGKEDGDQVIGDSDRPNIKAVKFVRHATAREYDMNEREDGTELERM